jgi:isoleucyl-tRNA synthetase
MARRSRKVIDNNNDGVVDEYIDAVLNEVRDELRDILMEIEIYQRTWIVPWFVQRLLNDLYIRLGLLLDKLGGSI